MKERSEVRWLSSYGDENALADLSSRPPPPGLSPALLKFTPFDTH